MIVWLCRYSSCSTLFQWWTKLDGLNFIPPHLSEVTGVVVFTLCGCLSVCYLSRSRMDRHTDLNFAMEVKLKDIKAKFVVRGHRSKVQVTRSKVFIVTFHWLPRALSKIGPANEENRENTGKEYDVGCFQRFKGTQTRKKCNPCQWWKSVKKMLFFSILAWKNHICNRSLWCFTSNEPAPNHLQAP